MREEQRGSQPEPCPAGSRARPPWLPPAPPALGTHPSGTPGAPLGMSLLQTILPLVNAAAAVRYALGNHTLPSNDDPLRLPTPDETRQRLVSSVEEVRTRLLLGDQELSDPLLRIFQNQLLDRVCRTESPCADHSADLFLALARLSFGEYPGGDTEIPRGWTAFPFPAEATPAMLLQMSPRLFTGRLMRQLEAALRDAESFEDVERFDQRVLHPLVALLVGAASSLEWICERQRQIEFHDSSNEGWRER